jgi:release factor glutamine methyltransferase
LKRLTPALAVLVRRLGVVEAGLQHVAVDRRLRREPVSRIVGKKGFWKIMLNVTPDVLSPRPDTETLLDVALLAFARHEAFTAVDLGTGSGAILLALLAEHGAVGADH